MNILDCLHIPTGKRYGSLALGRPGLLLDEQMAAARRRQRRLRLAGRTWNATIRRLLATLARARWPEQPSIGIFPIFTTRIRRRNGPGNITWWVEHDLPPYDRYRCAAYFVELEAGGDETCVLTVRSGQGVVRLEQPTVEALAQALTAALRMPPVIIPRQMGAAFD